MNALPPHPRPLPGAAAPRGDSGPTRDATGAAPSVLWAPRAWIAGRWHDAVRLEIVDGRWHAVQPGVAPPPGAQRLPAPVLPGLVDAHGHAFQRAFVGLAERRGAAQDDFWAWRDRMYGVALRVSVAQVQAIATHLYAELLAGGYTQVCEFHYLHHTSAGTPHDPPAAMSLALADAAVAAGIGLTLLPVLYERAGFAAPALRDDQRRFAADVDTVLALQRAVHDAGRPHVTAGAAIHSLRAAAPASLLALAERAGAGPLHVHVAEQVAEIDDCLRATGLRPIAWLAQHAPLDARWHLVHATHALPAEIDAVAAAGAGVVLCPATEANLGDGLADLPRWLAAGVPLSIGSDSHVVRTWPEELRWLEYGQRLVLRSRNVAADPPAQPATAARLFDRMLAGGAAAAGLARWGLVEGARADLVLLDADDPAFAGIPPDHLLDAVVFGAAARPFARTMVAGRWIGPPDPAARARFDAAMHDLWSPR